MDSASSLEGMEPGTSLILPRMRSAPMPFAQQSQCADGLFVCLQDVGYTSFCVPPSSQVTQQQAPLHIVCYAARP